MQHFIVDGIHGSRLESISTPMFAPGASDLMGLQDLKWSPTALSAPLQRLPCTKTKANLTPGLPKPSFQSQLDVQKPPKSPLQGQLDVHGLLKLMYFRRFSRVQSERSSRLESIFPGTLATCCFLRSDNENHQKTCSKKENEVWQPIAPTY